MAVAGGAERWPSRLRGGVRCERGGGASARLRGARARRWVNREVIEVEEVPWPWRLARREMCAAEEKGICA